jgi:hypothetical protein
VTVQLAVPLVDRVTGPAATTGAAGLAVGVDGVTAAVPAPSVPVGSVPVDGVVAG